MEGARRVLRRITLLTAGMLAAGLAQAGAARAETVLRVGVAVETRSLDPHLTSSGPTVQALRHIFEPLVAHDAAQNLVPGLAESWAMDPADATRWRIRLRAGVAFHDGQPLGAADVVASLARAVNMPRGMGGYASYLRQVTAAQAIDDRTLELRTAAPHAALAYDLSAVMIVQRRAADLAPEEFVSGGMVVGTGPYRHVAWRRGEVLELARANAYWGPKPQWKRVRLLSRAKDATRVSALLAGEVDLIEQVPTASLAMLERRDDVIVVKALTSRLIFLGLDMQRAQTPHFTDAGGQPLVPNPLRDKRVREAISIAIDRQALATQMMDGSAMPAGQLMPPGHPGTSPALPPDPYDPARARALLREAGIPEGARLVLHGPNDRYLNDKMVLVAIAAMLRRVGLAVEPVVAPFSVHRALIDRGDASFALTGWATETGDASLALRALVGAPGRPTGWGQYNWHGYVNEDFEATLAAALREPDAGARARGLARATEMAIVDRGLLPLYFQQAAWASRRGIIYRARADEYTLAPSAERAP